jgi:hypothetical protein
MSEAKPVASFEEFWPEYVRAHANKTNRTLHFVGTSLAMACLGGAVLLRRKSLLLLAPIVGYGFAWTGHFGFEKNVPATFGHPLWSLQADFKMWKMILDGSMDAEVERILAEPTAASAPARDERPEEPKAKDTSNGNGVRVDPSAN